MVDVAPAAGCADEPDDRIGDGVRLDRGVATHVALQQRREHRRDFLREALAEATLAPLPEEQPGTYDIQAVEAEGPHCLFDLALDGQVEAAAPAPTEDTRTNCFAPASHAARAKPSTKS